MKQKRKMGRNIHRNEPVLETVNAWLNTKAWTHQGTRTETDSPVTPLLLAGSLHHPHLSQPCKHSFLFPPSAHLPLPDYLLLSSDVCKRRWTGVWPGEKVKQVTGRQQNITKNPKRQVDQGEPWQQEGIRYTTKVRSTDISFDSAECIYVESVHEKPQLYYYTVSVRIYCLHVKT